MAINFAAEHMQGYNNPDIEIINVEISNTGEILTGITYNDIEKILARGTFPIVSLWSTAVRYILPLAYTGVNEIMFTTVTTDGLPEDPSWMCMGIVFTTDARKIIRTQIKTIPGM